MSQTYIKLPVSKAQRRNLETLLGHMKKVKKKAFSMRFFAEVEGEETDPIQLLEEDHACGTVCCMVGNGPLAGIKPRKKENDWFEYANRVFGTRANNTIGQRPLWDWLFHPDWAAIDNTPQGGARRLKVALTKGIPENYRLQLYGHATYECAKGAA